MHKTREMPSKRKGQLDNQPLLLAAKVIKHESSDMHKGAVLAAAEASFGGIPRKC